MTSPRTDGAVTASDAARRCSPRPPWWPWSRWWPGVVLARQGRHRHVSTDPATPTPHHDRAARADHRAPRHVHDDHGPGSAAATPTGPIVGPDGILGSWNGSAWVRLEPATRHRRRRAVPGRGPRRAARDGHRHPVVHTCGGAEPRRSTSAGRRRRVGELDRRRGGGCGRPPSRDRSRSSTRRPRSTGRPRSRSPPLSGRRSRLRPGHTGRPCRPRRRRHGRGARRRRTARPITELAAAPGPATGRGLRPARSWAARVRTTVVELEVDDRGRRALPRCCQRRRGRRPQRRRPDGGRR